MCGILGVYGDVNINVARASFGLLKHRGSDAAGEVVDSSRALFHCLHAVVGHVKQPLEKDGSVFLSNCEIYNWKLLDEKYEFGCSNDAEVLFALLEKFGVDVLDEVDGVYAFAWEKDGVVVFARDILGVKPFCYVHNKDVFAFASEGKALLGYGNVEYLLPTELLIYDVANKRIEKQKRDFFRIEAQQSEIERNNVEQRVTKEKLMKQLEQKLVVAVKKRIAGIDHVGILFSGGVDSTVLAFICKKLGVKFTCYTAAFADGNTRVAPDLTAAQDVATELGFLLKHKVLDLDETEKLVADIVGVIETKEVVKVGVAMPFFVAAQMAAADGCKVLLSGLGSEELYAGYKRHLDVLVAKSDVNEECLRGLQIMWDRDLYRDDLVCMHHTVELRLPFLDKDLVGFSLGISAEMKLDATVNKKILRETAVSIGVPDSIAMQPKRAAQYGSNFDKALEKLAKRKWMRKKEYLDQL
jgi:diphthine-ammonia ligase